MPGKTCRKWGRLAAVGISGSRLLPVFFGLSFFYQEQFYMFRFSKEYAADTLWQVGGATAYLAAFVVQFF